MPAAGQASDNVSGTMKIVLSMYLLVVMTVMVYVVYGLWGAEPCATFPACLAVPNNSQEAPPAAPAQKAAKSEPQAAPKASPPAAPEAGTTSGAQESSGQAAQGTPGAPRIERIEPSEIALGASQSAVSIRGAGFQRNSIVTFNGANRAFEFVNEGHLVASLVFSDFNSPGPIVVKVASGEQTSDGATLTVRAAGAVVWRLPWKSIPLNQETRLILLVLATGALGASVVGLQSLSEYMGTKKLTNSWVPYYFIRPAVGSGIAFVFYLVLRGGLSAGTGFDAERVDAFGLTAVAALVGMFSQQAMWRLREVSKAFFGEDKLPQKLSSTLSITTPEQLPDATVGVAYSQKIEVTGGTAPHTWSEETSLPAGLGLDSAKGELTGTPTKAGKEVFTIRVKDAAGVSTTRQFKLTIK
jgi:hypothetical protein